MAGSSRERSSELFRKRAVTGDRSLRKASKFERRDRDHVKEWELEKKDTKLLNTSSKRRRDWEILASGEVPPRRDEGTVDDDELRRQEEERVRDIKERDSFAQRLRERDNQKTRNIIEDRSSRSERANRKNREMYVDEVTKKNIIPDLRERSRQDYLKKREEQRLQLLEKKIVDEQETFGDDSSLTEFERRSMERDRRIFGLVKERMKLSSGEEEYRIPKDYLTEKGTIDKKRIQTALHGKYEDMNLEEGEKSTFVTEQGLWEQRQIVRSMGKSNQKVKDNEREGEYDHIFDEQQRINFIKQAMLIDEVRKDSEDRDNPPLTAAEYKALSIKQIKESLPVYAYRDELLNAMEQYQILVVLGETGSGKTTQIPQYLHEAGYTKNGMKVGITQPRRVAAMSVAARVAEEMDTKVGYQVGYSIRFEDCTSEKTVLKYMTDGMLLREFLTEPDLRSYSVIIIDEAHERTLHTDILFGLVKDIARYRKDLKVLVSSATMDAEKFSEYFDDAPIFNIPGRRFPVEIYHTAAPEANYIQAALSTILTIHISQPPGDILLFLTGQEEIENAEEILKSIANHLGSKISEIIVVPCYANLPSELQAKIFEPTPEGTRKVVLATNVAETSITIDGVVYVIDPGFEKQNNYNPRTGMESLVIVPCSRASAKQRAGRAGRVAPGKCFRLYTSWAYKNELEEVTVPEIQRVNMSNVVLLLKSLGINDLMNFDFMDPPPSETLIRALEQLYSMGALNSRGELTKMGRAMAEFPMDPMLSKTIMSAEKYSCTEEIISIISMLSVASSLFYRPKSEKVAADQQRKNFFRPGGDHFMLLAVWNSWVETGYSIQWCYENYIQHRSIKRARDLRDQLVGLTERTEVRLLSNPNPGDTVPIRKAIASGFFFNVARSQIGLETYKTIKTNQAVMIHPSCSLHQDKPRWILYHELVYTSREFMRQCIEINPEWLLELAPHYYTPKELEDERKKKTPIVLRSKSSHHLMQKTPVVH